MSRVITDAMLLQFKTDLIFEEKSLLTVQKYVRDLKKLQKYLSGKELNKELVIQYKKHLMASYAPSSVNSIIAATNKFFKSVGWYDCLVKSIKIQRQNFRAKEQELTKAEYFRLLEAAKLKGNTRLYMLMQTICATGIRVSELSFISVEALNTGMAIVSLKGKVRHVLIPTTLRRELLSYIKSAGIQSGPIFVTKSGNPLDRSNILHGMKSLCPLAGVDKSKVYPHNLRHLFACQYYKAEKDLSHLADILGHSNLNTTRIYTSVSGGEQQLLLDRLGLVAG